ncbi:hypothetical protein GCM10023189_22160 [Nibrella saemangeumensis]|uniref:CcmD family protein n=1 Tax=Nibrella saemangeumensis TaxID=1084526 RepID=A0ABP8MUA4_9BACT
MRVMLWKKVPLAALLLMTQTLFAQASDQVEMADRLRADGKIWVVVLVIAVVFAGIVTYLVRLDRQIGKLEKDVKLKKTADIRS